MELPSYHTLWSRMGLAPGFCSPLHVEAPLQRRLCYGPQKREVSLQTLHCSLLRRTNHTGSDVRITTGSVLNPKNYPRQSACAGWWFWSKVFACRWSRRDHINSLELRSVVHAIEWRIKHLKETNVRVFHLTDSYVAMSIISKGRTSSKALKPLLNRLAVAVLAWGIHLVITHVESGENPTDHASRS